MAVSGQSLRSEWVAENAHSLEGEVEQISLLNCLANAPTAALSNMVPITLISLACFTMPDWRLMGILLALQMAINLFKLFQAKRITSTEDRRTLRFYELVLCVSGALWGSMLLPLADILGKDITAAIVCVILIATIAITSMAIASQRRFFTAFIFGFGSTALPIALIHRDLVGLMPNLAILGFILILDSMTKASFKQTRDHIRGQIENRALADQLAAALEKSDYLATRDSLTGLLNRRAFEEAARSVKRHSGRSHGRCIIILDLDHFKSINDTFGHANGDAALQSTAAALNDVISPQRGRTIADFAIARWGGEEFIILLDNCAVDQGLALAEDIRIAIMSCHNADWPNGMSLSGSFGVAVWPDQMDLNVAVSNADAALYQAKKMGRNRVWPHGKSSEHPGQLNPRMDDALSPLEEVA